MIKFIKQANLQWEKSSSATVNCWLTFPLMRKFQKHILAFILLA